MTDPTSHRGADQPDQYRLRDLERRLGEDADLAGLGIRLLPIGDAIHVRGEVSTTDRRTRVLLRVHQACPGCRVIDEMTSAE